MLKIIHIPPPQFLNKKIMRMNAFEPMFSCTGNNVDVNRAKTQSAPPILLVPR